MEYLFTVRPTPQVVLSAEYSIQIR